MKNHRLIAYLMLLAVSMIWGVAGPVIKYTLAYFPPLVFLTYRFFLSAAIALGYAGLNNHRLPKDPTKTVHMLIGGLLGVPVTLTLLFFGFERTTSLSGTVITTMAPLFVVFLGAVFLHDRVTPRERLGIALALVGTLFISLSPLLNGNSTDRIGSVEGNAFILLSIVAEAVSVLYTKISVREHVSADVHSHTSFMLGFATVLPVTFLYHTPAEVWNTVILAPWQAHLGVLFMALISGTLAYVMRNRALRTVEISESALFTYLYPLWGAPLSILWLREKVSTSFFAGSLVILAGVILAELKNGNHASGMKQPGKRRHRR